MFSYRQIQILKDKCKRCNGNFTKNEYNVWVCLMCCRSYEQGFFESLPNRSRIGERNADNK